MLMEEDIDDKFFYQYPDQPAILDAQRPYQQIISDTTTTSSGSPNGTTSSCSPNGTTFSDGNAMSSSNAATSSSEETNNFSWPYDPLELSQLLRSPPYLDDMLFGGLVPDSPADEDTRNSFVADAPAAGFQQSPPQFKGAANGAGAFFGQNGGSPGTQSSAVLNGPAEEKEAERKPAMFSAGDGGQGGLLSAFFSNGGDMDMLNSAFLKGMEEANKFLPTNNTLLEAIPGKGARLHRQEGGGGERDTDVRQWPPGPQVQVRGGRPGRGDRQEQQADDAGQRGDRRARDVRRNNAGGVRDVHARDRGAAPRHGQRGQEEEREGGAREEERGGRPAHHAHPLRAGRGRRRPPGRDRAAQADQAALRADGGRHAEAGALLRRGAGSAARGHGEPGVPVAGGQAHLGGGVPQGLQAVHGGLLLQEGQLRVRQQDHPERHGREAPPAHRGLRGAVRASMAGPDAVAGAERRRAAGGEDHGHRPPAARVPPGPPGRGDRPPAQQLRPRAGRAVQVPRRGGQVGHRARRGPAHRPGRGARGALPVRPPEPDGRQRRGDHEQLQPQGRGAAEHPRHEARRVRGVRGERRLRRALLRDAVQGGALLLLGALRHTGRDHPAGQRRATDDRAGPHRAGRAERDRLRGRGPGGAAGDVPAVAGAEPAGGAPAAAAGPGGGRDGEGEGEGALPQGLPHRRGSPVAAAGVERQSALRSLHMGCCRR
uniref:Uncharacterized protein n=1 Tax=Triticum urartu TaxID=4572 RepID=A0A8R7V4E5_TRIUA